MIVATNRFLYLVRRRWVVVMQTDFEHPERIHAKMLTDWLASNITGVYDVFPTAHSRRWRAEFESEEDSLLCYLRWSA